MKFSNVMSNSGEWLRGEGPHHQVVISSRVRLARNLRNRAFPGWAKKAERTAILELIKPRVEKLPEMQDSFSELLQDLLGIGIRERIKCLFFEYDLLKGPQIRQLNSTVGHNQAVGEKRLRNFLLAWCSGHAVWPISLHFGVARQMGTC